jgi:hypothetical protein
MTPTIGQVVHYQLSDQDADRISNLIPATGGRRNAVNAGDVYPATIVRAWNGDCVNLAVQLDGQDSQYWATSREPGTDPGTWAWPTAVEARPDLVDRHPGTTHLARLFTYAHLPAHLQDVSRPCAELADAMIAALPDGPELTAGLRKLLEAKDCLVRAALAAGTD